MSDDSTNVLDDGFRALLKSGQSLAGVLLHYEICNHCQHVFKTASAATHSCPSCEGEIRNGRGYPSITIRALVDLIQDHYRMELCETSALGEPSVQQKEPRHGIGIVLLFCTFVECWMEYFLVSLMRSRNLPESIIDRMLSDNRTVDSRKRKLFKTLTGEAFGDVLKRFTEENKRRGADYLDYQAVWSSVQDARRLRNDVIHKGAVFKFGEDLPERCIKYTHGVNSLFIALHNGYVANTTDCGGEG